MGSSLWCSHVAAEYEVGKKEKVFTAVKQSCTLQADMTLVFICLRFQKL